ncbi:hypothetical protein [Desulfosporosinus sp. SB140]|uniref:hypothetical protein n=1 Tax=Desulfosporosinus paludis TaxID=3115649 RepID=UPI003890B8C5
MEVLFQPESVLLIDPEGLVIVSHWESEKKLILTKVYEREDFLMNPDPYLNEDHLAQYFTCLNCFSAKVAEILEMYAGWSKIDKTQPIKLIGIHNQDPKSLYIQFSLGQRYFVYLRQLKPNYETVSEELFGKKDNFRLRALCPDDEKYLISNLKFIPKSKRAISFYPQIPHGLTLTRRYRSLPYSC